MLYFAYGANLNLRSMKRRCPAAQPLSVAQLDNYQLRFCRYADILPREGSVVLGALYKLSPACVRALDAYEGPDYRRITVTVNANGRRLKAMAFAMAESAPTAPPDLDYYREVARGYQDWKIDEAQLRRARYDTLSIAPQAQATPGSNEPPKRARRAAWDPSLTPAGDLMQDIRRQRGG